MVRRRDVTKRQPGPNSTTPQLGLEDTNRERVNESAQALGISERIGLSKHVVKYLLSHILRLRSGPQAPLRHGPHHRCKSMPHLAHRPRLPALKGARQFDVGVSSTLPIRHQGQRPWFSARRNTHVHSRQEAVPAQRRNWFSFLARRIRKKPECRFNPTSLASLPLAAKYPGVERLAAHGALFEAACRYGIYAIATPGAVEPTK